jgi:glucose-6-phosphate isomerase
VSTTRSDSTPDSGSPETYGPRTEAWQALERHAARLRDESLHELFESDPVRFIHFSLEREGLLLDFSRQLIDRDALDDLIALAAQTQVGTWKVGMFAGLPINNTEDRPALHVALRRPADQPIRAWGENVMPAVEAERHKIRALADRLHAGELRGASGRPITDIVNIGIGGSDLGIVMVLEALAPYHRPGLNVHCVSNIDGVRLSQVLSRVDPETTLFVICSKTFTTLETLTNARAAREWLVERGGEAAVAAQFVAVSTNQQAMDAFGIAPELRFGLWDWVGGRYSVWSAVGLTVALAIGSQHFDAFLAGAHAMDEHFREAPLEENLPVLLAMVDIWNRNFLGAGAHAVLPYDDHLHRFPAYLQQLEMESNGKRVRRNGEPVECDTCPVIFGEPGSNAQHSFYQLLHQGTANISADFLLPARSGVGRQDQQDLAAANCLAQAWALAIGDLAGRSRGPHQAYPGNRPSTLILMQQLDPATLGKLVALYEHKVFVQGVVWDVNPFDQWGVELGKRLAKEMARLVGSRSDEPADGSGREPGPGSAAAGPEAVAGALARYRSWRA